MAITIWSLSFKKSNSKDHDPPPKSRNIYENPDDITWVVGIVDKEKKIVDHVVCGHCGKTMKMIKRKLQLIGSNDYDDILWINKKVNHMYDFEIPICSDTCMLKAKIIQNRIRKSLVEKKKTLF